MMSRFDRRLILALSVLFAVIPFAAWIIDQPYYMDFFRRVMIISLAALSLDLILSYGGMISFGHAAYLGVGGYAVGILASHGIHSGLIQWPVAIIGSALFAFAVGAISLKTTGVYFIMITLAFTQMLYFLAVSLKVYGGDDGMTILTRTQIPLIDLDNAYVFYYFVFVILFATLLLFRRVIGSRFGRVLRGSMENERRMQTVGFPTTRYKLTAFTIAGAVCGLAGVLLANHQEYISPDAMHWSRSGDLLIILVLGGIGAPAGSILGATTYLTLEAVLSGISKHWQIVFGPLLLLIVLFSSGGINEFIGHVRKRWQLKKL